MGSFLCLCNLSRAPKEVHRVMLREITTKDVEFLKLEKDDVVQKSKSR